MSWFSSKSEKNSAESSGKQNFFPVTASHHGFGALTEQDTTWSCANNRGFQTETQVWYSVLGDGSLLLVQVIWTYLGVFVVPATAQMTFKYYNPHTKQATWKSINASGFKPHGRGCKSDQFEIKHTGTPEGEESYEVTASLDKNVQISVSFNRPASAPGFKLGSGPTGGISTFGTHVEDGKRDGFVVHRFHPMCQSTGSIVIDGEAIDTKGEATFIHAIQGMRPDTLATRWNFAFFSSGGGKEESKLGSVRAVQMEFETTDSYGLNGAKSGRVKVNVGAIYASALNPQAYLVVGQASSGPASESTPESSEICSAQHFGGLKDSHTGYSAPTAIEYKWSGASRAEKSTQTSAQLKVENLTITEGEGGLIEKVNVLAEIPYVIRKALSAATGTKPYIYQYLNPATLKVDIAGESTDVQGWLFNEASFVSQ
ncbi:oxidative stress survival, Svf1-like protein [Kockovaella imperatae]|uniref:Oxidative stress survival, Svf1-like protein n=1 Tax=Kockovaella imperatae TaxID=4999 RepID=A0A1Y1UET0_9TREE|nr:oxidative stress survival, Svf1-like protein [Kockovaella imperatae]ORX36571.1 oxidative stress survival, Svf1-like protein [Kockovaella imperatae]